jgi:UDPglucose 6-dehydrogenase
MKISIIGCGYVGTVTGAGFAELGNEVIFVDIDEEKVNALNSGRSPVFEPGLEELIVKNRERLRATTDFRELEYSDISFICVGTPSNDGGSVDLRYVKSAAEDIGHVLDKKTNFHLVVVKSTVVPGTTDEVVRPIIELESHKKACDDFGVAMNPEFLREGSAVEDFFMPDRIVFGTEDERSKRMLEELYNSFNSPKLITGIKTAEMIKYVSNSFLATKISFANEIGNICKKFGIDTYNVFKGVGLDHRINPSFFGAGIGFGGSCFPKDVRALIAKAEDVDETPQILKAVISVNEEQPLKLIEILKKHIPDLGGRKIGVLGLAFKPDTDDIRESRAIPIIDRLIEEGADVMAYDPKAMDAFKKLFPQIAYASPEEVLMNSDAVVIVTEWHEFEHLDYTGKIVIDGRRVEKARIEAAIYEGVCW